MRLRRMLAFVLTLALLLGNVTPAYAADTSVVNSISGDVTVTSDENGNLVLTNNSDGTSEVLNLEDETQTLITGEETQTPTTGEETQTPTTGEETQTPTAGEETQTPTTGEETQTPTTGDENQTPGIGNEGQTSDEGEETQTPEGDGTQTPEGEDETLGEEDEVLDEDLEEEVSEEEELDEEEVELVTEEDIKLSNGTISIDWNGGAEEVKYTTVKEALDAAEELAAGEEGVTVNLPMEEGGTFTVTGSDLVVADDYTIALDLHGNTLTLDATEGAIVKSNVNILDGTVKFGAENMTFQILEKVNAPSINNLIINDATETATLKIGGNSEDNSEALQNACVNFYEVSMSGIRDMVIQDGFYTNSAITADTMRVDLDWIEYQSEEGYTSKQRESTTLNSVDVNELEVNGCVYWSDGSNVSVKESTRLTGGSVLNLAGTFVFHNLVVSGSHSEVYDESVSIKKSFYGTTGEDGVVTYTTNSELTFAESVMIEEGNTLDLNCEMSVDGQWAFDLLPYGHAMADITAETTEGCISADLFQVEGAKLVREGNQLIVREQQEIFRASYWNGNTWTELGKYGDFTTLYDALDDNPDSTYNVELLKNVELSDGEHWNFADLIVNLQLYKDYSSGYTISVAENANASITVDYINSTYINGYELSNWGSGYFNIGDGATLNLRGDKSHQQKDSRSLSMQNLQFMTGNNSKLVCNSQNPDVREMLTMNACYFYNTQTFDIELYGNVNWNPYMRGNNAGQELMQNPVNATPETFAVDFRSLKIENEHPNGAFIGNVITVDNLNVNGNLNCDTLTADNTILKAGSFVCTTDVMTLKNITVTEGENTNCATLATEDIYKAGKLYHTGEIRLQDSLNCGNNTCINFDKSAVNVVIESNNYGSYPEMKRYEEGVQIKNNDVLANLSAPGGEPGQLLANSSYALFRDGFKSSVQQDESGNYAVKAVDTTSGIFVMDNTTGKMKSCEGFAEVKEFILTNAIEGSRFEIILNKNTSTQNLEDLDYSDFNDTAEIKLTLNGYELKLMENQVVAVDIINGFKMNSDARGKLALAAKNTIKPRRGEAHIWGTDLKSNSTDLILGNADDMLHSNLHIDNPGSGISLKNLTTYGYVNWMGDTSKTLTITETLTVNNIHSQEDEVYQSAEFYCKVTTKNLNMTKGDLNVADLTVSNKLTAQTGRGLMVTPEGKVSLKDIHVTSEIEEEWDGDHLRIELHRRVELASEDNPEDPSFENAKVIDDKGTVTISGAVTADSKVFIPVRFMKNNDYRKGFDQDGNEIWSGRAVNFENREAIANVTTAPANKLGIITEPWDENACTRKEGTTLQAATRGLTVRVDGYNIPGDYESLEDAIANIPKEFVDEKGNAIVGSYRFIFFDRDSISKSLTLPACVEEAVFTNTDGDDSDGYPIHFLNLNSYTLTAPGSVVMQGGLCLEGASGAKLVVGKDLTINARNMADDFHYNPIGNITVDVSKGQLTLSAQGDKVDEPQASLDGTITAKSVYSEGGGSFYINDLTVKGGWARIDNPGVTIEKLTLDAGKLFVGRDSYADIDKLEVKAAYAQEDVGDYTVVTDGFLNIGTLNMPVGTMEAGWNGVIHAETVTTIKDLILGENANFTCNNFTQAAGGKTYLGKYSFLFIKEKGTLETIVIGGKGFRDGEVRLGTLYKEGAKEASITINQTPVTNSEELKLQFLVTNSEDDSFDHLVTLEEGTPIFKLGTAVKTFPTEYVEVLQPEEENHDRSVYQDGNEIKVVGEYITVHAFSADGNSTKVLKSFTNWTEAMKYLAENGNSNTEYLVVIDKESVSVGGSFGLPTNVKRLMIQGNCEEPTNFYNFTGDISLGSDTDFIRVTFDKDGNQAHGMATNGKEVTLVGVTATFKSLTGTKDSHVLLWKEENVNGNFEKYEASKITVTDAITNLGFVGILDSSLEVTGNKAFTVTDVLLRNGKLKVDGKATITNLKNYVENKNEHNYIAARELVISGDIISNDTSDVKAVPKDGGGYTFEEVTNDAEYTVKKNAISLTLIKTSGEEAVPAAGTYLGTATKVPASWFVVNLDVKDGVLTASDLTYKEGSKINCGAQKIKNVVLDLVTWEGEEAKYATLGSFETLQKALDEIASLSNAEAEYRITLKGNDGSETADYKFPEKKAAHITICSANEAVTLTYKKDMDIKANVRFENVILNPSDNGAFKVNKYVVELADTTFAGDKQIKVSDSGAEATLKINNANATDMTFASMSHKGIVSMINTNLVVSGDMKAGRLVLSDSEARVNGKSEVEKLNAVGENSQFTGLGAIKIGDIYCEASLLLATVAAPTWGKETIKVEEETQERAAITALANQLTITGKLEIMPGTEEPRIELWTKNQSGKEVIDDMAEVVGACAQSLLDKGIVVAKAANINTSDVVVLDESGSDVLVKKNGELLYKDSEKYVTLGYVETNLEGGEQWVSSSFETFADVKKEIETLNVKRDYTVIFNDEAISGNPIPKEAVMNLSMPKAASVNSLTLVGTVYYTGSITFTSDVILHNMNFVQVVSFAGNEEFPAGYYPIDVMEMGGATYPAAVKVSTGGYGLFLSEENEESSFNTPIELTGNNKGVLDLTGSGSFMAGGNWNGYKAKEDANYVIQGTVKGFAFVKAGENNVQILGYPVYSASNPRGEYKSTALETTALTIEGNAEVLVGYMPDPEKDDPQISKKDNAKVKELTIAGGYGGGYLSVMGDGEFTNVALSGAASGLGVLGQKFVISGNLISTSYNAFLGTTYNKDYASVLEVKGNVVLEDREQNRITVCVTDALGTTITLGDEAEWNASGEATKYFSNRLLTATKANANDFRPAEECVNAEEYGPDNPNGYMLKKNGNYIEVWDGSNVEAALYVAEKETDEQGERIETLVGYYPAVNEAVAAIDAFKDSTREYKIVVMKSVGTDDAHKELKMPKQAAKVTFEGYKDNDSDEVVRFNKDITLGCDTEFKDLLLYAESDDAGGRKQSVKAGKFELKLDAVSMYVKDISSDTTLYMRNDLEQNAAELNVSGKATLRDVELIGCDNYICYSAKNAKDITIKGEIRLVDGAEPLILYILNGDVKEPVMNNHKLTAMKVANVEKADFNNFVCQLRKVSETIDLRVAWDSKAIYCVADNYPNAVEVTDELGKNITCLDIAEASEFIKNMGSADKTFTITLTDDVTDANVSDTTANSKLTLPDKDKAAAVILDGDNHSLQFTDNIKTAGVVTIQDVELKNTVKDFDITNDKNSKGAQEAELTLQNVTFAEGSKKAANIKGAKTTLLNVVDTDVKVSGSITDIAELKLTRAKVEAANASAKHAVSKLVIEERGIWEAYGVTTIGEVELASLATGTEGINTYIGTYRASKTANPNLTITGRINEAVPVKVYEFNSGNKRYEEISEYSNQKLLNAKAESAEKFIAADFAKVNDVQDGYEFNEAGINAYKDTANFVLNGDITQMEVILTDGEGTQTYVKTYADAVKLINNIGKKTADYTITLLNAGDDTKVVKTEVSADKAILGKLLLPEKDKAASVLIKGEEDKNFEIRYTGTIAPKCEVRFENVHLSEGTVAEVTTDGVKEQKFTDSGVITLDLANGSIGLGNGVTGGKAGLAGVPDYYNNYTVAVKTISGAKGNLLLAGGQKVYVQGAVTIPTLMLSGNMDEYALYTSGKTTITNIVGVDAEENISLELGTYHGTDLWTKGKTQLEIKGDVSSDVNVNITPYIMQDKATKTYAAIEDWQITDMLIHANAKPADYQKIATAPKLASENITLAGNMEAKAVKYDGGLYFTREEEYAVKVVGYDDITPVYTAKFFTWEQAVKEIDKLDKLDKKTNTGWNYDIVVLRDLGTDAPLAKLDMPQKAVAVNIIAEEPDIGILTTAKKIDAKSHAGFSNIAINGVQAKNGNYYPAEITVNAGNYEVYLFNVLQECGYENGANYVSRIKLSTSAKGTVDVVVTGDYLPEEEGIYSELITEITGAGSVGFYSYGDRGVTYNISGGIKGVNNLTLYEGIHLESDAKEISVKNLFIEGNRDQDLYSGLRAKNITVSGDTTLKSADLKAGTTAVGDGKITLGNVTLNDIHNHIEGKVDKSGKSLIEIKGTVDVADEIGRDNAVTISLCLSNSVTKYVQLAEGMTLLKAPKAASSVFRPHNDERIPNEGEEDNNPTDDEVRPNAMGPELWVECYDRDENGEIVNRWYDLKYNLYKNGDNIVYGRVRSDDGEDIAEVRVWIGTDEIGEAVNAYRFMDFMTFEDAVKAIDKLAIQNIVTDENGKQVKEYKKYTIQLLREVKIGNEKGDGSYKTLTLPSKVSDLTIWGCGREILFSGKVTLKSNTKLSELQLRPLKKDKNGVVFSKADFAVGNYVLTVDNSWCEEPLYDENGQEVDWISCVGKITGSAKSGRLVMKNCTWVVDEVSGLNAIEFAPGYDENSLAGIYAAAGKLAVKDVIYNSNAWIEAAGDITIDTIRVNGEVQAEIAHNVDKNMKVNGTTIKNPDNSTTTGSVFFENPGEDTRVILIAYSMNGNAVTEGTQVITGKYLNEKDWIVLIDGESHNAYLQNNSLYVGSSAAVG